MVVRQDRGFLTECTIMLKLKRPRRAMKNHMKGRIRVCVCARLWPRVHYKACQASSAKCLYISWITDTDKTFQSQLGGQGHFCLKHFEHTHAHTHTLVQTCEESNWDKGEKRNDVAGLSPFPCFSSPPLPFSILLVFRMRFPQRTGHLANGSPYRNIHLPSEHTQPEPFIYTLTIPQQNQLRNQTISS